MTLPARAAAGLAYLQTKPLSTVLASKDRQERSGKVPRDRRVHSPHYGQSAKPKGTGFENDEEVIELPLPRFPSGNSNDRQYKECQENNGLPGVVLFTASPFDFNNDILPLIQPQPWLVLMARMQ